jgi:Zn-dependent protease with chaperone function
MPDVTDDLDLDDVDLKAMDEVESIDLDELDPEAYRPGLPWLPPIGLVAWLTFIPIVSILLRNVVSDRASREDPGQMWLVDLWGTTIAVTLLASLVLVLAVPIAVRLVRGRDAWILATIQHGFRIAAVPVTAVIALHTLLAVGLVYGIEYLLLGTIIPSVSALFFIAGLGSVAAFAVTAFGALRDRPVQEPAMYLDRSDAPGLHDVIIDLAADVGVDPPTAVVIGPTMDWWTGTSEVELLEGRVRGTLIHVSLPMLALLSVDQVRGILAHELAHRRAGDLDAGQRLARAHGRMEAAISALRSEATGAGRLTATPALAWLDFAEDAIGIAVGERMRVSESAADAVAVSTVGSTAIASGLLVGTAIASEEETWAELVDGAIQGGVADPVGGFVTDVQDAYEDVPATDIITDQLLRIGPTHPALITRLRDIDQADIEFALPDRPALGRLLRDPQATTARLIDLLRPRDAREERLELNPPTVTAGLVGWLVVGVIFAIILAYRIVGQGERGSGDIVLIAAIVGALWLLFPIVYPWLQREAVIDQRGIRLRPWWWHWLDETGERFGWTRMAWSPELRMKVGFESNVTLTDGSRTVSWWAGLWPKAEREHLYNALRDRGVAVAVETLLGDGDPARYAVVYHLPDRFLLPEIRRAADGQPFETTKVKSISVNALKLGFALIDRLHDPVALAGPKDIEGDADGLAAAAKIERAAFDESARRVLIVGTHAMWTVEVDGDLAWTGPRAAVSKDDMDEVVFDVLGLDYAIRQPKPKAGPPDEVSRSDL